MAQSGASAGAPPCSPRPTTARSPRSSGRSSRTTSSPAGCPAWSPPAASSSASTWARSTSSSRSSRRRAWPARSSASAAPATRSARSRRGVLFPKHRGDLAQTAVAVERMRAGAIESLRVPDNPLDVLAQQVVATSALDAWTVDDLRALVRRVGALQPPPRPGARRDPRPAQRAATPPTSSPSCAPRIVWDRVAGTLTGRPGAQRLAVTSGGTIPDRGLFGVFLARARAPAGGSASSTRRWSTSPGSATSSPSARPAGGSRTSPTTGCWSRRRPGSPGGCRSGRATPSAGPPSSARPSARSPASSAALAPDAARARGAAGRARRLGRRQPGGLPRRAARGHRPCPSDRTLLVERFRDELGDWRLVVHSPYGTPVHAPWALAITPGCASATASTARRCLRRRHRAPDPRHRRSTSRRRRARARAPLGAELLDLVLSTPTRSSDLVTEEVGGSALFAARFRECAARALLLPRRDPAGARRCGSSGSGRAALLEVASEYPSFPIVLEAVRECLQDVYDLPALVDLMRGVDRREVRSSTSRPSSRRRSRESCSSATSPSSSTRATPPSPSAGPPPCPSTRACSPSCSARAELLASCSTPRARRDRGRAAAPRPRPPGPRRRGRRRPAPGARPADAPTRSSAPRRRAPTGDDVAAGWPPWRRPAAHPGPDRRRGALGGRRGRRPAARRARRRAAARHARRVHRAVDDPLGDLVARFARTHGPFTPPSWRGGSAWAPRSSPHTLRRLVAPAGCSRASSCPGRCAGSGARVVRRRGAAPLRRRSLAALREEVEPVEPARWAASCRPGSTSAVAAARARRRAHASSTSSRGAVLPACALESLVLPRPGRRLRAALLDELTATGEVIWAGHAALPGADGWVSLHLADQAPSRCPAPTSTAAPLGPSAPGRPRRAGRRGAPGSSAARPTQVGVHRRPGPRDHPVGPGLGRPGQQRHARPAARADSGRAHRAHGARRPAAAQPVRRAPRARSVRACGARSDPARAAPARAGPPRAGRWALLPPIEPDPTRRAPRRAERLLDRHGVVTAGRVVAEEVPGGFAAVYKVLAAFEDSGRCRRGYFVEGLGAAQFGTAGAIDRLRSRRRRWATQAGDQAAAPTPSPWPPPTRPTPTARRCPGPSRDRG